YLKVSSFAWHELACGGAHTMDRSGEVGGRRGFAWRGSFDGAKGPTPCKTHTVFLIIDFTCSELLARCWSSFAMLTFETPSFAMKRFAPPRGRVSTSPRGAGRVTRADKGRAFTIARGECVEAA